MHRDDMYHAGLSTTWRDPGHWDVMAYSKEAGMKERAFRIRGNPGRVVLYDERSGAKYGEHPREPKKFVTVREAMAYVVSELMDEPGFP